MKSSEIRDGNLDLFGDVLGKKINLQFSDGQVKVVPVSAEINPNINNLIANLNQLLEIEPLGKNKYAIRLKTYDKEGNVSYRDFARYDNGIISKGSQSLATFEIKTLSLGIFSKESFMKSGFPFAPKEPIEKTPLTDLHTHFTGVLSGAELYEVAIKSPAKSDPIVFSKDVLLNNGYVSPQQYEQLKKEGHVVTKEFIIKGEPRTVELVELSILDSKIPGFKDRVISKMEISAEHQETFKDLDAVYDARKPFFASTDTELYDQYFLAIAKKYKESGVKYCELSVAPQMFLHKNPEKQAEKLEHFSKLFTRIQKEYGVDIKFLLGNSRSSNSEKQVDEFLFHAQDLAQYPFVSGVDVLGHERTSNREFEYMFASMTSFCIKNGLQDYTIRCHTGESTEYEDNTKVFLQAIKRERDYLASQGYKVDGIPDIRIGHGLHGMDEETIDLCRELGATIEINASSNFSLNNVDFLNQVPIKSYLDKGLKVVIGTDGGGVYGTDSRVEALVAQAAGVTKEDFDNMQEMEQGYIEMKQKGAKGRNGNIPLRDKEEYEPETAQKNKIEKKKTIDLMVTPKVELMKTQKPIVVAGPDDEAVLTPEERAILNHDLDLVVERAKKGGNTIFLYGGEGRAGNNMVISKAKESGVAYRIVHDIKSGHGIDTHGVDDQEIILGDDHFSVARDMAKMAKEAGGEICVIGGGVFASELITTAKELGHEALLEGNVRGASKEKRKLYKMDDTVREAERAEEEKEEKKKETAVSVGR